MNTSTRRPFRIQGMSVSASDALNTALPHTRHAHPTMRRLAVLLVFVCALVGGLVPAGTANAAVRLDNGAYPTYGLDCGYRSAKLTVQAGANGIGISGFKYWIYSVDYQLYLVSDKWVPVGSGWSATTITLTNGVGRYNVYVQYWSYAGGRWYTGGEWAWARNFVQPRSSQTCIVN